MTARVIITIVGVVLLLGLLILLETDRGDSGK